MHSDNTTCPPVCRTDKNTHERLLWIDWMKTIGISLIVYGHFFSLFDIYVYVFSVPMFFILSGFLSKHEKDSRLFWRKIFFNLVLPLIILCTFSYIIKWAFFLFSAQPQVSPENPLAFYIKLLAGVHGAVGTLWFVYTLIILKIILQYTKRLSVHILIGVVFLASAFVINNFEIDLYGENPFAKPWAVPNVFICYPFFMIGYYMRGWRDGLTRYRADKYTILQIAVSLLSVFICGHNHKYVYLYSCGYGDSIMLCLFGGVAGTALVFLVSKLLEQWHWRFIVDISVGTIVILGLHWHLIFIARSFFPNASFLDLILAVMVTIVFVPVIRICETHFPVVMGKYRVRKL